MLALESYTIRLNTIVTLVPQCQRSFVRFGQLAQGTGEQEREVEACFPDPAWTPEHRAWSRPKHH